MMNGSDRRSNNAGALSSPAVEASPKQGREGRSGEDRSPLSVRDEVEHRLHQQEGLAQFGLDALRIRDLGLLLQAATERCAAGMRVRLCKALRYDPAEDLLTVCAGVGWKSGIVGIAKVGADTQSPAGFALKTGRPVISNHLENEDRFRTPKLMVEHGVRRAINVLIMAHDQSWGVLEVDSPDEGKFEEADVAFMQGFANLLGVAIERHDAEDKLQQLIEHQRLLVKESSHRVKNSLALVASLLHLQARTAMADETVEALNEAAARIQSVAGAHDQLWRSSVEGQLDLKPFLADLANRLQEQAPDVRIRCTLEPVVINAERAIAVGLLTTELVTNALKHAYPGGVGTVDLTVACTGPSFTLQVIDKGRGLPDGFDLKRTGENSLGLRMVRSLLRQVRGDLTVETRDGTSFSITAPV